VKKDSLLHALMGAVLFFSSMLLVNCNSSAGDKTVAEGQVALTDTSTTPSYMDTTMLAEVEPAMEKPEVVPQTVASPAAKPAVKKKPAATTTTAAKPKAEVPPAVDPTPKTPDVAPPASTPPPVVEPKPVAIAAPKAPVVKQVPFVLKSTKAIVKGSSSLHAWESNITQMEGKGAFETKDDELVAVKNVEIKIAVTGIKSKEGKKMDNKTYETFKSGQNPYIVYTLSNAVVKVNASNVVTIEASGKLTMAGNSQSVPLSLSGKKLPNGDLQLSVSKKLKMTDYKMEPPVMLLGTIKVGNEITVEFDFVLERVR
jgi:polyisoprenoid-binding protein YceI